jgi:hypothetical protein
MRRASFAAAVISVVGALVALPFVPGATGPCPSGEINPCHRFFWGGWRFFDVLIGVGLAVAFLLLTALEGLSDDDQRTSL